MPPMPEIRPDAPVQTSFAVFPISEFILRPGIQKSLDTPHDNRAGAKLWIHCMIVFIWSMYQLIRSALKVIIDCQLLMSTVEHSMGCVTSQTLFAIHPVSPGQMFGNIRIL